MAEKVQMPHAVEGRLNVVSVELEIISCPLACSAGAEKLMGARA